MCFGSIKNLFSFSTDKTEKKMGNIKLVVWWFDVTTKIFKPILQVLFFSAIFFLSLSDFVFCTIMLPLQAVRYFTRDWPFGKDGWTCRTYPLFFFSNIALSVFILSLIAVNRAAVLYDFR